MTEQERQQYNSLSWDQREEYDRIQRKHPNWSHKQIMTRIAFDPDPFIEAKKDPNSPDVMREILQAGKAFLIEVGCFVWDVFALIDDAIDALTDMIDRGLTYIGKKISDFWDWLTS